jgi:hypothetical protein
MRTLHSGIIGSILFLIGSSTWAAAPIANNDARVISIGSSVTINALNNDSDPDGDLIHITNIVQPGSGTAILRQEDNAIIYTPLPNFTGQVRFQYTLEDIPNVSTDVSPQQTTGTIVVNVVAFTGGSDKNSQSVGEALVKSCDYLGANNIDRIAQGQIDLKQRCEGLLYLAVNNPAGIDEVVRQISPEETLALTKAASGATQGFSSALGNHLNSINGGNSFTLNGAPWQQNINGGAAGNDVQNSPWSLFGTAQIETADKTRTALENGFNYAANSILLGVDYRMTGDWVIGIAGGMAKNTLDFLGNDGSVNSDTQSAILYNMVSFSDITWDIQVGMSSSNFDISRRIHYTDNQQNEWLTQATTHGQQTFVSTSVQYDYTHNAFSLYPSIKIGFTNSSLDAYGENNGGGYEMNVGEQSEKQTKIEAGLQGQYVFNVSWGVLIPTASATFINEHSGSQNSVDSTFAFGPQSGSGFTMTPETADTRYYQASVGSNVILPNGLSLFLNAQKTLGYENFTAQYYSLGARLEL